MEQLEQTNPRTVTAFISLTEAYEELWHEVNQHPSDAAFVAQMLGLFHFASLVPRMERL
jgi:hypothetical protein